jgi:pyruvate formate lyase activating enzyme
VRGYILPTELAKECVDNLSSLSAKTIRADRIFFSGGEPTIHLPYIEEIIEEARKIRPDTKVNFDTNGYMTEETLERVLDFTTSITYDLKAFHEEVHRALTGASARPVLRNAEFIGNHAKDKLWEYRIVVIPKINDTEIQPLVEFIAAIDPDLPVCFLSFRPNFVLEDHSGATLTLMERCVDLALNAGLKKAHWSGHCGITGSIHQITPEMKEVYSLETSRRAATYAERGGCRTRPRNCTACNSNQTCQIKMYIPTRVT